MNNKVVIVDDDRVTLSILEKALTEAGLEVLTAEDGMKGLDLIQTTAPAVAIVDMLIPKLHGVDLCRRVKENELLIGTKVILMSAVYQYAAFRRDIEHADADFFVNKPLDMPKLMGFVEQIMSSPPK
jgi:DNA-binding response OmpR family regulator